MEMTINKNVFDTVKRKYWDIRRALNLTPMQRLIKKIDRQNVDLKNFRVLDMFAGYGRDATKEYFPYVGSIEAWEINPACEHEICQNLPGAKVRIVDSYVQMKNTNEKFDMVFADIWPLEFGKYCEHFELFPDIFQLLKPFSILILNVLPEIYSPTYLTESHARKRKDFYKVDNPYRVSTNQMAKLYDIRAMEKGFHLKWWLYEDRYIFHQFRKTAKSKRFGFLALAFEIGVDSTHAVTSNQDCLGLNL